MLFGSAPDHISAPQFFWGAPTNESASLWRDLRYSVVPGAGPYLRDLLGGVNSPTTTGNAGHGIVGEARGRALRCLLGAGSIGMGISAAMPHQAPFSTFVYVLPRTVTGNQAIVGDHGGGVSNGWTFRLVQSSGQLGFTRWGIADEPSTLTPTANAVNAIGCSHDGTTNRFFLNGQFQNVASGQPTANTGSLQIAGDGATWLLDCSIFVVYVWARTLSDQEFLKLMEDPWLIVRPPDLFTLGAVVAGGGGGTGTRSFVAGFIG